MDHFAILTSMLWLPKEGLTAADVKRIKKACTIKYREYGETETKKIVAYRNTKNYFVVPRAWGMEHLGTFAGVVDYEDRTSCGYEAFGGISPVKLRDYQTPWVKGMCQVADTRYDFIGQAATGKGKTVMGTEVARRLGYTTLVVVDQENLIEQWQGKTWGELFGIPDVEIGHIQGSLCDWENKTIVVGMLQSLVKRRDKYPKEMWRYFGTVIVDEVHGTAAPVYHELLSLLPSTIRFGVTATPKRGPLKRLNDLHFGEGVAVALKDKHQKSIVRYIETDSVFSWYANISPKDGRFLSEIAVDARRNRQIAEAIKWLYDSGRDVLVIGARIEQLESLIAVCAMMGVPEEDTGQYTGYRNVWKYAKDPKPKKRPDHWEKDCEYTPVKFQQVQQRIPKGELKEVKDGAAILFATYGMFAKGVDVPRLSAGIDVTPRSTAEQVHGRILRPDEDSGKLTPIWVTIRDKFSFRADFQFTRRLREYQNSNAEVYKWVIGKGVRRQEVEPLIEAITERIERLKEARVEIDEDGNSTLKIPVTVKKSSDSHGNRTAAK